VVQFHTYLRADLGHLRHPENAEQLLLECGLPADAAALSRQLHDQAAVDAYVLALSDENARKLARACSEDWRRNDVFEKLQAWSAWSETDVPVGMIELQQAEEALGAVFRENKYVLTRVAADARVLATRPYADHPTGDAVAFPTCLAMKQRSTYRIFDGIHRAIQLVVNGEQAIRLCYPQR
jgi:hypothetical protein